MKNSTKSRIERVRSQIIPAEELTEVDEHCGEWKPYLRQVVPAGSLSSIANDLRAYFRNASKEGAAHLTTEQLFAFVDRELTEIDQLNFETHISVCRRCADAIDDLVEFKKELEV